MGIVRMGPPENLVLLIKNKYKISTFVETGTFKGQTAFWAAKHFDQVITVENSQEYYDELINTERENIEFLLGDSRLHLKTIINRIQAPAIFWLDSHWCGDSSFGEKDQCPLLKELAIINTSNFDHFILIDDARLFLSPPPCPNDLSQWPTILKIFNILSEKNQNRYMVIFEDVIVAVPHHAKKFLAPWFQKINTEKWKEHGRNLTFEKFGYRKQGIKLILSGTKLILLSIKMKFQNLLGGIIKK